MSHGWGSIRQSFFPPALFIAAALVFVACADDDSFGTADEETTDQETTAAVRQPEVTGSVSAENQESDGTEGGGAAAAPTELSLVAENIAFDQEELTVPAGQEVTITYENRDAGIDHNVRVNGLDETFSTEIVSGPTTQTLSFTIDEPGRYSYFCEVHPQQMRGELVVEE